MSGTRARARAGGGALPECSKPIATKAVMGPHSPSAFPGSEEEEAAWNTAMHTSLGNRHGQHTLCTVWPSKEALQECP